MRQQLGTAPVNPADVVTKTWVQNTAWTLANKTFGAGNVLGQNLPTVSTSSYAIPVNGAPYQAMVITTDITAPTLAAGSTGQLLIISVIQDGTGNHAFNWNNLSGVFWFQPGVPPTTALGAYNRTTSVFVYDSSAWIEVARQSNVEYLDTSLYPQKGTILAAAGGGDPEPLSVGSNRTVLTADSTQGLGMAWSAIPQDVSLLQTIGARATGLGDNVLGVKLQRAVTFVSVTFRGATEDASGSSTFELRKNGSTVAGTSTSVAAGSLIAGGTTTGTWSFSAGDILTVYTSAVGGTPGTGLVADISGYVA